MIKNKKLFVVFYTKTFLLRYKKTVFFLHSTFSVFHSLDLIYDFFFIIINTILFISCVYVYIKAVWLCVWYKTLACLSEAGKKKVESAYIRTGSDKNDTRKKKMHNISGTSSFKMLYVFVRYNTIRFLRDGLNIFANIFLIFYFFLISSFLC